MVSPVENCLLQGGYVINRTMPYTLYLRDIMVHKPLLLHSKPLRNLSLTWIHDGDTNGHQCTFALITKTAVDDADK